MKPRGFILFLVTVVLLTILVMVFFLTQAKTIFLGRAINSPEYNLKSSYIFASPLGAKTGSEKIRVTVFLLNESGRGVARKKISLSSNPLGLNFVEIQEETDKLGQAVFDVASSSPGQYAITALVEDEPLPQTVTVIFQWDSDKPPKVKTLDPSLDWFSGEEIGSPDLWGRLAEW